MDVDRRYSPPRFCPLLFCCIRWSFTLAMEIIKEKHGTRTAAELRFYVEFMDQSSSLPSTKPPASNDGPIMIFLKYYDPYTTKLE